MAVQGGSHKGNGSNGNRGKPYGLMLLLAFGAALLGVMAIHKLRERRIFNLLVKEKDNDIISLQLLLQKEREHIKEMKRKNEEMKAKIYSIRNQKMELERRLLEMQSTIDSLKDEQRTLESALEEKQNENNVQRETDVDAQHEDSQMVALMESLKQKEAEIEELKRRLDNPVKIWSVSSDDPSRPNLNTSVTTDEECNDKIKLADNKEVDEQNSLVNPARGKGIDDASTILIKQEGIVTDVEHRNESGEGIIDNGEETKVGVSRYQGSFPGTVGNNTANGTVATIHAEGNGAMESLDIKEQEHGRDGQLREANSQQEEHHDQQATFKGGAKLEMSDNSKHGGVKWKGKRVNFRSEKGKRWRMIARNRVPGTTKNREDNGLESTRGARFSRDDRNATMEREDGNFKVRKTERDGVSGENKLLEATKAVEPKSIEESENQKTKLSSDSMNPEKKTAAIKESFNGETISRSGLMNQRQGVVQEQQGQESNGSQESNSSRGENKQENRVVQAEVASVQEKPEETDEADADDDAAARYLYKDSVSDSEEYKEEIDESEF